MQKKIKSAFNEKDFQHKGEKWYIKENKKNYVLLSSFSNLSCNLIISQLKVMHFKSDDSTTSGRFDITYLLKISELPQKTHYTGHF